MTTASASTAAITFTAVTELLNDRPIIRLPQEASDELPSRGQVAVTGTLDGTAFSTVVEPDGRRGHWINLDDELWTALGESEEKNVEVGLDPTKDWPEVTVPDDLRSALDAAGDLDEVWQGLTPMARWEWVRWIRSTKNADTRARRVDVAISKLESGKRRPCCFDLSSCTDPELSKNGKLLGLS
ncbi:YdeI/OmpD-associated family protein [Brevibacterium spongiae]|uniref:YdeI/OmpD-associated family protein n=1 Tax=Brevibacterium spongiae TaxID=2909672 RepID=A0ABY5SYE3_9MICO|nr:YdeI/OmpD-associated family protein [Brevibacterium spongiae]UVI37714.1 YdeI/OmpD-associated family protein [Brevibacterium spongiae]